MPTKFIVEKGFHNTRFDKWFKKKVKQLPQSLIEKIVRLNKAKVNDKKIKSSYRLQEGDIINIFDLSKFKETTRPLKVKYKPIQKEINYLNQTIITDNENFTVINKQSGISVQSGTKSFRNVIDILKDSEFFRNKKPFIVHRLDKETSGILIIAKNREYAQLFTSLFRIRKIHKTYIAATYGKISNKIKILRDNLVTYENDKKVTQKAVTNLKILNSTEKFTLVELNPITGRKHQLRKQLFNIGHPVVGDQKYFIKEINYKEKNKNNNKLMLHAYKIKFMINNEKYNFKAKYNDDLYKFIKKNF